MPKKPANTKPSLRSEPQQERSLKRVEMILDAAAELFVEQGFAVTTTNQIAERAGTSIGSLYRVFPDKLEIFKALSERYSKDLDNLAQGLATPALVNRPFDELVPAFLTGIDMFIKKNPAFEAVFVFADGVLETRAIDHQTKMRAAQKTAQLIQRRKPALPDQEAMVIARTTMQLINAYMRMRVTVPEFAASTQRDHFASAISGYLSQYV